MVERVDTIVIGGSAGSFTALRSILPKLKAELPAAIFVCQHVPAGSDSRSVRLLRNSCDLPLLLAEDGMRIELGKVFFAPPDTHLMLGAGHMHLRRGAHENNFRPAIDPLFRSAAVYQATRAVGVILSGLLDDGAAGALAIARTGGRVLVQDPDCADYPDMPRAALRAVPDAEVLDLRGLARRMNELAGEPAEPADPIPAAIGLELRIASLEDASMESERKLGELSPYNCPHCNGVLWEIEDGPITRYRCHTGHAYSMEALSASQEEALDKTLFDTLRAHKGRVSLLRKMAKTTAPEQGRQILERRAKLVEEDALRLEEIIKTRKRVAAA